MTESDLVSDLQGRACTIIQCLAEDCTKSRETGHMTSSIYSTAWVSMILKSIDGQRRWLFPECFQYVLDRQLTYGGWRNYGTEKAILTGQGDEIICTMAALLALNSHRTSADAIGTEVPCNLDERIAKATSALRSMLQDWDITSCDHVGFELIVPAHLEMLEEYGTFFSFPGRHYLVTKQQQKLSKFRPEYLYGETVSTLLHILEALIGKVEFDKVAHHTTRGSMMASPASTAAYLLHASVWDDESENYLRTALSNGAVPDSWRLTLFEMTWVVKTLLAGGMTPEMLGLSNLNLIADYLQHTLIQQNGTIGWTPGVIGDADDTSSVIIVLNMLGRPTEPDRLLATFESKDRFRCYALESNSSPSCNSHVLQALLHTPNPSLYQDEILKAASFICDCWLDNERVDKWSVTEFYPMMLTCQALVSLLALWDKGQLPGISESFLKDKLRIVIFGILVHTLKAQNLDGSWGISSSRETTAYAMIVLATVASFPLAGRVGSQLRQASDLGRHFLLQYREAWSEPDHLWREKTTYGSGLLAETYTVAAMNITTPSHILGSSVERLCELEDGHRDVIFARFLELPMISDTPSWLKEAAIVESYLYKPLLKSTGLDRISQSDSRATKYIETVPFFWIVSSHVRGADISPKILFQMMVVSRLSLEIDHCMEVLIARLEPTEIDGLRKFIDTLFEHSHSNYSGIQNQVDSPNNHARGFDVHEIRRTLSCFVNRFIQNPSVLQSSTFDQDLLRKELRATLHGQLTSVEENSRLANADSPSTFIHEFNASETFYDWIHGTAAQHVGVQTLFAFFGCLLGAQKSGSQDCFPSVEAKYFAQDLSSHLGFMCRLENDYGSMIRDSKERNLNSVNFPEFSARENSEEPSADLHTRKAKLKTLAEFERESYRMDLRRLEGFVEIKKMEGIKAFCNAIDLGGQVYAVDDFSPVIEKV